MKLFVWDFHGVLEKGTEYALELTINQVLEEFGFSERIDLETTAAWYGRSFSQYFCSLTGIAADDPLLGEMVKKATSVGSINTPKHIMPMDYSSELLEAIVCKGHVNVVVSNSNVDYLNSCLGWVNLSLLVSDSIGVDRHNNNLDPVKAKAEAIAGYIEGKNFDEIIIVGDKPHDIEAGRLACAGRNAKLYLFSRSDEDKRICSPDCVTYDLRDLLKEIKK